MSEAAAPTSAPVATEAPVAAPQSAAAPTQGSILESGSGQTTASWTDALPPELKADPNIVKYKSLSELAKGHSEQAKLLGKPKFEAPQENWKPEQWNELYDKLGRPKTPNDYKFDSSVIPEGRRDEQMEKFFAEKMHVNGLTQKQAETLHKEFVGYSMNKEMAVMQARQQAAEEGINQLRQQWGDKFAAKANGAFEAAKHFGGSELTQVLQETGLGNHPSLVKMFASIAEQMAEDRPLGRMGGGGLGESPATALASISEMRSDKDFQDAFNNRSNPGHKDAVSRWNAAHEKAYGAISNI